jgi:predicted nucleic-acid-binding Zn-ribbon protein
MSEGEARKCPKCGNVMKRGDYLSGYGAVRLIKPGDLRGDKIIPFHCENCGYIELYNEKRAKE